MLREASHEVVPPQPEPEPPAVWSPRVVFWVTVLGGPEVGLYLAAVNANVLGQRRLARRYTLGAAVAFALVLAYVTWIDASSSPFARFSPNRFLTSLVILPGLVVAFALKPRVVEDVRRYRILPDTVRDVRPRPWWHAVLVAVVVGAVMGLIEWGLLRALGVPWA